MDHTPTSNIPTIHVVIVNWNSGTQLKDCLQSFAAVTGDAVVLRRVTVVDNASTDSSCDGLDAALPLRVIRNADNRGFGAACNQGAAGSDADLILFLNPDTRLQAGSLERPAAFLQAPANGRVGIVGIQLVDAQGHVARNCARAPSAWSTVGISLGLDRLLPWIFPPHFMREWPHDETRVVDQVMGAFFLVRRTVFDAIGGFDERFFVYYEDLDFAQRARALGWSSVYLASAQAFHRGQGTTASVVDRRLFYFARSKMLYALKYFSAFGAGAVMVTTLTLEPAVRMAAAIGAGRAKNVAGVLRGFGRLWAELPATIRTHRLFRSR